MEDVDLGAAELRVGMQLQRIRRKLHHRATKTEASDAALPLPDICLAALWHRRAQQETARAAAGDADFSIRMKIYTQVSSKQTRDALKRLGDSLPRAA